MAVIPVVDLRRAALVLLAVLLGCASVPKERPSPLGYTATVPDGWMAIGRAEIAGHETELESAITGSLSGPANEEVVSRIRDNIRNGNVEFFVPERRPADSYDNINVQLLRGQVPALGTDVRSLCDPLSANLSQAIGRAIAVRQCSLQRVGDRPAMVIEMGGFAQPDSVTLQYHLNHSPGMILAVTATMRASSAASIRPVVARFVESIVVSK
jgi:hypothetical protein